MDKERKRETERQREIGAEADKHTNQQPDRQRHGEGNKNRQIIIQRDRYMNRITKKQRGGYISRNQEKYKNKGHRRMQTIENTR